jgi:hypothetical protein
MDSAISPFRSKASGKFFFSPLAFYSYPFSFLAYVPCFENIKADLCDPHAVCVTV